MADRQNIDLLIKTNHKHALANAALKLTKVGNLYFFKSYKHN
jgi:hypothetical protein